MEVSLFVMRQEQDSWAAKVVADHLQQLLALALQPNSAMAPAAGIAELGYQLLFQASKAQSSLSGNSGLFGGLFLFPGEGQAWMVWKN